MLHFERFTGCIPFNVVISQSVANTCTWKSDKVWSIIVSLAFNVSVYSFRRLPLTVFSSLSAEIVRLVASVKWIQIDLTGRELFPKYFYDSNCLWMPNEHSYNTLQQMLFFRNVEMLLDTVIICIILIIFRQE